MSYHSFCVPKESRMAQNAGKHSVHVPHIVLASL